MKVSPLSIKKQEFKKGLRGYDQEEVQAFLEKLSDEFELLQKENEILKKELEVSNDKLDEFRKIEKNLQLTLLKAQESSSRSMESTKKQAGLIVKEAEIKASQILEKARESANEIRNAVIHLREERDVIISKLKAVIDTQSKLMEKNVKDAGAEMIKTQPAKKEEIKNIEIDVNDIVNRLL
ncbi:MAG TPA: DivIVA domain-containing protein [Ignavibacteriaceae bacterium]|nr:DivIVA domain-containing protein [Ignavibacteriaceae bacterium]